MTEAFDVSARLAEGVPAVQTVAQYVWACAQLGYRHPDLTLHAGQVSDWYGSEEGMDLSALQQDCASLAAVTAAASDALDIQERQLSALPAAWEGAGADASVAFLRRHSDASAATAAALRTAHDALDALRETLWRIVDEKVDTVIDIEGRVAAARGEWSAAAATVTTGAGDRAAASELVDQAVKPFVDNAIRTQWLAAMRTAMSSISDAYERATTEILGERLPLFAVAGDLGPQWSPQPAASSDECDCAAVHPAPAAEPAAAPAAPTAPTAPATVPAAWTAPAVPPAAAPADVPMPQPGALGSALPGLGGGLPDLGGGLSGLGQPFSDALSGLLGGGDLLSSEPDLDEPDLDEPVLDDPLSDDPEEDDEEPDDEDEEPEEPGDATDEGDEPIEDALAPAEGPVPLPAEPAPAPTPPPPRAEPLPPLDPPPAGPVAGERTPCEIAADELPQVGESQANQPGAG